MQPVNEYEFYELACAIHPLTAAQNDTKYSQVWYDWFNARILLNDTFATRRPLSVCRPAAQKLYDAITQFVPLDWKEAIAKLPTVPPAISAVEGNETEDPSLGILGYDIRSAAQEFETVLRAELQSMDTYFISPKGTHKTSVLLSQGRLEIPLSLHKHVPGETLEDFDEAGRCLLFDTSTAAAFHLLRATDAVLRAYYRVVTGKEPPLKFRNWGAYIKRLREACADVKVIDFLEHIKDNYRNPVLHPQITIDAETAQVLLGVCVSAIVAMAGDIKARSAKGDVLPFEAAAAALGTGTTL